MQTSRRKKRYNSCALSSTFLFLLLSLTLQQQTCVQAAEQPPTPNLPFGDINLIVLTDVHSWIGGHGKNKADQINGRSLDVDYGDVVSFYERIKAYCASTDQDVWFVQNGDWIDGTGLAIDGDPSHLVPLIEKVPFDVLNTGNHELYKSSVIEYMLRPAGFIEWWGDRHLASNVYINNDDRDPLSNHYTVLRGKHSTVLVFGFLYNMPNPSDKVVVQPVEEAVREDWFHRALTEEPYDAILVMLHAGHDDPSVVVIRDAIRQHRSNENMPIQFIAGHTHYRRYAVADPISTVVEAGRYLDTVGWVSFPNANSIENLRRLTSDKAAGETAENETSSMSFPSSVASSPTDLFQFVFLDANVESLKRAAGVTRLETPYGKEVKTFIEKTQQQMGLEKKIGCAPRDYLLNASMGDEDSLWRLYRDEVVQHELVQDGAVDRAIFIGQGSWRYDLYGGSNLTYDDVIAVSPFNEPVYLVGTIPGHLILELNQSMNENMTTYLNMLPEWILAGQVHADRDCELYGHHFGLPKVQEALRKIYPDLGDPTETNLTSTTIWLSFVANQWKCPGGLLNNPWLTSMDATIHNSDTFSKLMLGLAIASALLLTVVFCRYVNWSNMKCCGGSCSSSKDYGEMETFHDISAEESVDYDNGKSTESYHDGHDDEPPVRIV